MTILLIAGAALGAIAAFRKTPEGQKVTEGQTTMTAMRRSTSVVLALAEAVWAVLDALVMLTGRRPAAAPTSVPIARATAAAPAFGTQPGADVRT